MSDDVGNCDASVTPELNQPETPAAATGEGGPLTDEELLKALNALTPGERIEDTIAQLGLAAYSVSFAKIAAPRLDAAQKQAGSNPVGAGLKHLVVSVLQKAVVDVAATFDQTGDGSSSLSTALNMVCRHLKASPSSSERTAALKLVAGIRREAIESKTPEIEYVRYLRNKWAAHSSMDLSVDPWKPGKSVDFAKLEAALQQMQRHFVELASLIGQVTALEGLEREGRRVDENTVRMGLDWDGFGGQALHIMGSHGENSANSLMDRIEPGLTPAEPQPL